MAQTSNRTKLLQDLTTDVTVLKKEFVEEKGKVEHIANWIKENFKPVIDELKEKFGIEVEAIKQDIETNAKFSKNLTNWVKDNFGTKLEKLTELIVVEVGKQILQREKLVREEQKEREAALWEIFNAKQAQQQQTMDEYIQNLEKERDEAKGREAALWNIFKTQFNEQESHFEEYMQTMADERNNAARVDQTFKKEIEEEQEKTIQALQRMEIALQKMEDERNKIEDSRRQLEKSYEMLMVEAKKRPEAEAEMFQRLTKKLDTERKLLATELQKLEAERKKLADHDEKRKTQQQQQDLEKLAVEKEIEKERKKPELPFFPKYETDVQTSQGQQAIYNLLNQNGLGMYYKKFIECGYESLEVCALMDDTELIAMDISKPGHRKAILQACSQLKENGKREMIQEAKIEPPQPKLPDFERKVLASPQPEKRESITTTPKTPPSIQKLKPPTTPQSQPPYSQDTESSDTIYSGSEEDIFANK